MWVAKKQYTIYIYVYIVYCFLVMVAMHIPVGNIVFYVKWQRQLLIFFMVHNFIAIVSAHRRILGMASVVCV